MEYVATKHTVFPRYQTYTFTQGDFNLYDALAPTRYGYRLVHGADTGAREHTLFYEYELPTHYKIIKAENLANAIALAFKEV